MTTSRPRGRPRKSSSTAKAPENTTVAPTPEPVRSAEVDPGSIIPDPVPFDKDVEIDVALRRRQWDNMSNIDKGKLGMTFEEFISSPDVTGMGPNSRFTMPEERGLSKMRVSLPDR